MEKRRFSATGLEADVEILDGSVGRGVLVEDAVVWDPVWVRKFGSAHFEAGAEAESWEKYLQQR